MRSYRSVRKVAISSFLIVIATVALTSGIAADPPVDHCNPGNVDSAFQAWVTGGKLWNWGLDHGGLAEGYGFCEYRLFAQAAGIDEVCFCEDDYFFGGNTFFLATSPPDGVSPEEAQAVLAQLVVEVEITPEGGEPLELDVVWTDIKGGQHYLVGKVTWQQHAVFLQLPPGDYVSTYRYCHPNWGGCDPDTGDGWWPPLEQDPLTTLVRVLEHDVAQALGRTEYGFHGSVNCPED
jgi:hypothetical protein